VYHTVWNKLLKWLILSLNTSIGTRCPVSTCVKSALQFKQNNIMHTILKCWFQSVMSSQHLTSLSSSHCDILFNLYHTQSPKSPFWPTHDQWFWRAYRTMEVIIFVPWRGPLHEYVCICVYMYVYVYLCAMERTAAWICVYMYVYVYLCAMERTTAWTSVFYVYIYACMFRHSRICKRMNKNMSVYILWLLLCICVILYVSMWAWICHEENT
jgi:hypothetical protein